jgi:hypothetical protein
LNKTNIKKIEQGLAFNLKNINALLLISFEFFYKNLDTETIVNKSLMEVYFLPTAKFFSTYF